jgi:hypothetical protein
MGHGVPVRQAVVRAGIALSATGALLLASVTAEAEDAPNLLEDPWGISLGTFILDSDTELRLNGESRQGDLFNWEDTFGGGQETRFRVDGQWRFGDRHKLRFLWFNSSRTKSRTLERDIHFGDETFPLNARVEGEFSFDIYELAYEYAFMRRENFELNGSIGLHYADLSTRLAARAETSGGTLQRDIEEDASVAAPLPVIGLRGLWGLPHNFWIDASAQYFALSFDEYDGNLQDYRIGVTWQPRKWLGVGLGYNQFGVDVDVEKDRWDGSLDWTYRGPMLYYSASF